MSDDYRVGCDPKDITMFEEKEVCELCKIRGRGLALSIWLQCHAGSEFDQVKAGELIAKAVHYEHTREKK